ncbi:MAG: transglutaminase domain-containing protein [Victivallales bacterium]|nr:transglutaminase domain-containing protein [Victivallales bacterium]
MAFFFNIVLYGIAVAAALWEHGQPVFTLSVLGVIVLFAVASIIFRGFHPAVRCAATILFPALGLAWLVYRFLSHDPADKFIVEALALAGIGFFFTSRPKEQGYLLLISAVLLAYGGVFPREAMLYMTGAFLLVLLILFYLTRLTALSVGAKTAFFPSTSFRKGWWLMLFHATATVALAVCCFSILPVFDMTDVGFITSSFFTNNENKAPESFQSWFNPPRLREGKNGRWEAKGSKYLRKGKKGTPISLKSKKPLMSVAGNGGSAPPRDKLVFKVASKAKLYWLCQLYDQYDGKKWIRSKKFKKSKSKASYSLFSHFTSLPQVVSIVEWRSSALPAAFIPSGYSLTDFKRSTRLKRTFYGARIADMRNSPRLPFNYSVFSRVVDLSSGTNVPKKFWTESLKPKHYKQLPSKMISKRLRELAKRITAGKNDDYTKSIAIRNYLRSNFKYKQFAYPVPFRKEAVDYFVFDLKKGHCEYFAAAMTVLARLNGMPARVATGYSPGNYNLFKKCFEVYEYHAHAWSQVFVRGMGWLTLDASPPGSVISRTTPVAVAALKDPFGDEWRVKPPELTERTQKLTLHPKMNIAKKELEKNKPKKSKLSKLLLKIPVNKEEISESYDKLKRSLAVGERKKTFAGFIAGLKKNFRALVDSLKRCWRFSVELVKKYGLAVLGVAAFVVLMLFLVFPLLSAFINKCLSRLTCERLIKRASKLVASNPRRCVKLCYLVVRDSLNAAGYPRERNKELFQYGNSLENLDENARKDILVIFLLFSKSAYSREATTPRESVEALERLSRVRASLLKKA